MGSNSRQKIGSGIRRNFANQMVAGALQPVVMIILGWPLTPHDYGAVGRVLTFTGCAAILGLALPVAWQSVRDERFPHPEGTEFPY